jgi:hypothetical protein
MPADPIPETTRSLSDVERAILRDIGRRGEGAAGPSCELLIT